jgi:hypothetical protein
VKLPTKALKNPAPNGMKQDCIKECGVAVQEAMPRENN